MRFAALLILLLAALQGDARRAAALERLARARERVADESAGVKAREARVSGLLKERTAAAPLRLDLGGGSIVDQVKVTGFEGGRVKLAWPQGTVDYPLETLPKAARAVLLDAILTKGTPRDQFDVGRLLLRGGDFDAGQSCVEKAVAADASLKPLLPDVERLRRMARIFEAPFSLFGSQIQSTWTFRRTEELSDFAAGENCLIAPAAGGGLQVSGPPYAYAMLREVAFRDRLKVSALPLEGKANGHVLGIQFTSLEGSTVLIYVAAFTSLKALLVTRLEDGVKTPLLEPVPMKPGARLEMEFARGKFSFRSGDKVLWTGNEGGFQDITLIVGSLGLEEAGAKADRSSAVFREVTLTGTVNPDWLKRRTLDYRAALQAELERERRLEVRQEPGKDAGTDLSVDADTAKAAPADYRGLAAQVRQYLVPGDAGDPRSISEAVVRFTRQHPDFAPGWYWRGRFEEASGRRRDAESSYGEALTRLPDFPEALCGKARLLALRGEDAASRPLVDRAVALQPDLAEAYVVLSRLEHTGARPAQALEAAALAKQLAPEDADVQTRAQMLENAARGPGWPQAARQETTNYVVKGDLPAARLRAYGEHLEALRGHYQEVMESPPAAPGRKSEILVFASPEGYYSYLDLTSGRRMENTLGVFNPWYGQMMLFEDADPEETLRVASHEGFHQFLNGIAQDVPQWFNEGMAEYVGAAGVKNGKLSERGGLQVGRLIDLLSALMKDWKPLPFAEIMTEPKSSFYGKDAALKYAQAWSMIHFLMHGEKGRHQPLLKDYVRRLLAGDSPSAAHAAVFGKADTAALEASWLAYVKSFLADNGGARGVDLLPLVDLRQDTIQGVWKFAGGRLLSPPEPKGGAFSLVRVPYVPPAEYDLTMVVERREQNRLENVSFDVGLLGPGGLFFMVLDAHGRCSYLNGAPGGEAAAANRKDGRVFTDGKPRTLLFSVRREGLTVSVDGAPLLQWRGDLSQVRNDYGMKDKSSLYLGSWIQFGISKMELVPVKGRGRKAR